MIRKPPIMLLVFLLLVCPVADAGAAAAPPAAAAPAPARLAVLAADGADETAALADLLTVRLTETPGVETVERVELDRVLREQALTAAGLADGVRGRVTVGRLLRVDGFLFVARIATRRQFAARLVEARSFSEPARTEYYLQSVKMGFIDWRRHGGWAFRSDIREAVCPGIESRLETGPFDPYLAEGDRDKVRRLALLVRQQETPETLHMVVAMNRFKAATQAYVWRLVDELRME